MVANVPSLGEIRKHLPAECRRRSYAVGTGLFVFMAALVASTFGAVVFVENFWLKLAASFALSVLIPALFVIGHDACHSALTPSPAWNGLLARLAFLPALHPASTWALGHNQLHHGWTNLKGVDYGYAPFSLEEFRALPAWRRAAERFYRTLPGIGFFYMVDIWWRHLFWPRPEDLRRLHKGWLALDVGLVTVFLAAETWLAAWWGWRQGGATGAAVNVTLAVAGPFLIWNWIMAFATLQHHTHPRVAWFDSREEWNFFFGQVEGTVHMKLPRWLELFYHNIFEHTAHHVDTKIPLYRLHESQRELELAYPVNVTILRTSPSALAETLRKCKLYDYRRHCWTDFQGRPTAEPILVPKTAKAAAKTETPAAAASGGD